MTEIQASGDFEKEVAKSIGKEAADTFFGFLNAIVRPPSEELGQMLRDTVRFHRFKNQLKILQKAELLARQSGRPIKPVDPKLLASVVQHGSSEDIDEMQDKWAALLANAAIDSGRRANLDVSYADILRQITPRDARVLDMLSEFYNGYHDIAQGIGRTIPYRDLKPLFYDDIDFLLASDNLKRLNLVAHGRTEFDIHITTLGLYFVERCTPHNSDKETL